VSLLRCPHCRQCLQTRPAGLECISCGRRSPSPPDVELVAAADPTRTLGAAFMGSRLAARIYQSWWRPLTFGLSSGFRKPTFDREAELILAQLERHPGPWLDLVCGPGALAERMLERAQGRLVVASDLSPAMLHQIVRRFHCLNAKRRQRIPHTATPARPASFQRTTVHTPSELRAACIAVAQCHLGDSESICVNRHRAALCAA